jgi:hypothetical protein
MAIENMAQVGRLLTRIPTADTDLGHLTPMRSATRPASHPGTTAGSRRPSSGPGSGAFLRRCLQGPPGGRDRSPGAYSTRGRSAVSLVGAMAGMPKE